MSALQPDVADREAFSIPEWCEQHSISLPFFYVLKKRGKAPRVTKVGARRIITKEDSARWRKAMSEESAA